MDVNKNQRQMATERKQASRKWTQINANNGNSKLTAEDAEDAELNVISRYKRYNDKSNGTTRFCLLFSVQPLCLCVSSEAGG
jgi:hypothetical protein